MFGVYPYRSLCIVVRRPVTDVPWQPVHALPASVRNRGREFICTAVSSAANPARVVVMLLSVEGGLHSNQESVSVRGYTPSFHCHFACAVGLRASLCIPSPSWVAVRADFVCCILHANAASRCGVDRRVATVVPTVGTCVCPRRRPAVAAQDGWKHVGADDEAGVKIRAYAAAELTRDAVEREQVCVWCCEAGVQSAVLQARCRTACGCTMASRQAALTAVSAFTPTPRYDQAGSKPMPSALSIMFSAANGTLWQCHAVWRTRDASSSRFVQAGDVVEYVSCDVASAPPCSVGLGCRVAVSSNPGAADLDCVVLCHCWVPVSALSPVLATYRPPP